MCRLLLERAMMVHVPVLFAIEGRQPYKHVDGSLSCSSKMRCVESRKDQNYFFRRAANAPATRKLGTAGLLAATKSRQPGNPLILPTYPLTMSAALKDDIKSAMSGVGITLSGDMLSKCEFLCCMVARGLLRPDTEKPAPSRTRQPLRNLEARACNRAILNLKRPEKCACIGSLVGVRGGKWNCDNWHCFLFSETGDICGSTH